MSKIINNPKLRFKEFTNDYNTHQISELIEDVFERNGNDENRIVLSVSNKFGLVPQSEIFEGFQVASEDQSNYKVLHKNYFAFNPSRINVGSIAKLEKYETGIISPMYEVFKVKNTLDPTYFYNYFRTNTFKNKMRLRLSGSVRESLSLESLKTFDINLPDINEQIKIGTFLQKIDENITLHQKKIEKIKKIKFSYLKEMFPQNNEIQPKRRFEGFKDNWEIKKLGDIASKVSEKNNLNSITETFTNSAEFGVISQRDYFEHDVSNEDNLSGYYIIQDNDFVYNPRISTTAPVGPINRNKLGRPGVMSPLYTVFRTKNVDYSYLEWFFKSGTWHNFMYFNGDTGARSDRFSIKDSVFFEMPIPYPSLTEQQKIGEFFCKLEDKINIYQKQLNKLKNLKESYLKEMFV